MDPAETAAVEDRARDKGLLGSSENILRLEMLEGKEKLPAAWLVEHAGFCRGYEQGRRHFKPARFGAHKPGRRLSTGYS